MTYATVCSGIGAPEEAWKELWGPPVFTAEIEPFPSAVLKHHYPEVPNYGDMTKYKEWLDHEQLGLICGGTPCQSFSVAGLRKGMDDPRGNLTLTFLGLLARYNPRWFVWENVPGVFSSISYGESDFGRLLHSFQELGYSCAYRVLDAQCFGVPQRRRRVFVVGHLGNDWRPPFAVLFEPESLRGNIKKGREAGQGVARCLKGKSNLSHREDPDTLIMAHETGPGWWNQSDKAGTLRAEGENRPSRPSNIVMAHRIGGPNGIVRRLTPMECERLQGFPDGYTAITYRGKPASDGPRYKALGNSMAVPVVRWIGRRIKLWEDIHG